VPVSLSRRTHSMTSGGESFIRFSNGSRFRVQALNL
jgi:hypothetical protein